MALTVVRHGETQWSLAGRHTGCRTDLPLTDAGRAAAAALAPRLAGTTFALVLTSPLQRARTTAALAGFPDAIVDADLAEWDYGDDEGLTRAEILERSPGWSLWRDGCPGGESPDAVAARLDRVVARVRAVEGDAIAFAHGHSLRSLAARW